MAKKETSTYPLRLPKSLKEAAAHIAREDGTSFNQFVATAVAEKVSAMKTADFLAAPKSRRRHRGGASPAAQGGRPAAGARGPVAIIGVRNPEYHENLTATPEDWQHTNRD